MTVIADSSFIYALFNARDFRHRAAASFASTFREVTIVPDVVLPEIAYLFKRDVGYSGLQRFLERFLDFEGPLQAVEKSDLSRMHEIATNYESAEFDIVDCCIMAMAERLQIRQIATFDRRDFSIFRPRHCEYLELLP